MPESHLLMAFFQGVSLKRIDVLEHIHAYFAYIKLFKRSVSLLQPSAADIYSPEILFTMMMNDDDDIFCMFVF